MGQLIVRQLDDAVIDRLKERAREQKTSVEALARQAITSAAALTVEEKLALARKMQAWGKAAQIPGAPQTPGWVLIREDRDHGH